MNRSVATAMASSLLIVFLLSSSWGDSFPKAGAQCYDEGYVFRSSGFSVGLAGNQV